MTNVSNLPFGGAPIAKVGIEQFHHPRPVGVGRGSSIQPTEQRKRLLAGLTGLVVEYGAGDGVKLSCYPSSVQEIILVEPDPFLRGAAEQIASGSVIPSRVVDGSLTRLPVPDQSCDAVVFSLVLCCAPLQSALAEARRVLRPGGELRFYEHVRSPNPLFALTEALVTPIWSAASGGCHPTRNPLPAIEAAGFTVAHLERFVFLHISHVLGAATSRG
ncbi:class I SAM-dependent methyltransferase [Nonomuraea sp. NPDC050310]|uniref:class I SAM-dependent methyltransferase n=1 Tax=Nonomuraea sp. NPDC050310 TaxID=3154935 RepID=UPI0033CD0A66